MNDYEYPDYYKQCIGCAYWISDHETGNVGCTCTDIWDEEGNEIDEKALKYQDGIIKCPHKII